MTSCLVCGSGRMNQRVIYRVAEGGQSYTVDGGRRHLKATGGLVRTGAHGSTFCPALL